METFLCIVAGFIFVWWCENKKEAERQAEQERHLRAMRLEEAKMQAEQERHLRAMHLSDVDYMNDVDFEHYVCRLLNHKGFSAEVTEASNDFGVDIIATSGDERIAIQVKRYTKNVSRKAVSDAVAGKAHYGCECAMVVTNSYFTKSAIEFADSTDCTLVDRNALVEWILDFQNPGKPVVDARSGDTWVHELPCKPEDREEEYEQYWRERQHAQQQEQYRQVLEETLKAEERLERHRAFFASLTSFMLWPSRYHDLLRRTLAEEYSLLFHFFWWLSLSVFVAFFLALAGFLYFHGWHRFLVGGT